MSVLYNLRHDGEQYRVTKFVDGEVESSYLTTHTECDCPAGFRSTCRHRQMLPDLLPIIDTHWFLDHGTREVVDLMGTPKATLDALIAPLVQTVEPKLSGLQEEMILMGFHQPELCAPAEQDTELTAEDIEGFPDGVEKDYQQAMQDIEALPTFGGAISIKYDSNGKAEHGVPEWCKDTEPPHKAAVRTSLPPVSWRRL